MSRDDAPPSPAVLDPPVKPNREDGQPAESHRRPSSSLRLQGLFSVGWSGLTQVITFGVRLASTLVMTRLLAPEAYGLFATAFAVVITLEWFSDLGVMPSLLRHPEGDTRVFLCTGWWINVLRGIALTLFCMALSFPLTLSYYRLPGLLPVLLVLSTVSTIQALRSPVMPRLRRALDYRAICIVDLAQLIVSTGVSLILAWQLRSVWAIVCGTIAGTAAATVASYVIGPMRPGWTWDRRVAADISLLSKQILVNTLVAALWMNADRLLGLRFATTKQMGLYAVAWNLSSFLEGLALRACDIYYSMLTRMSDAESQAEWHTTVCKRFALWGMPVMAAGVLAAPIAVRLMFDRRYAGAGVLFALLVARLMARLPGMIQFEHLLATAEVWIATRAYLVAAVVQVLFLTMLGRAYGVVGIALSGLASTMVLSGTQAVLVHSRGGRCLGIITYCLICVSITVLLLYFLQ